jgi:hypothetical protein
LLAGVFPVVDPTIRRRHIWSESPRLPSGPFEADIVLKLDVGRPARSRCTRRVSETSSRLQSPLAPNSRPLAADVHRLERKKP